MRAFIIILLSSLVCLAASSGEAAEQLAVFYLEEDPAVAGEIQQRLEARLRGKMSGGEIRPTADVAARLAPPAPKGSGVETKKVEENLLEARKSFWNADLVGTEMRITRAESTIDAMGSFPSVDRANVVIWRAALLLAKEDASGAEREVARLLALAPDAKVDLDVFPPSLGKLVERVRDSLPKPVIVNVRGLPKGSRLWIDNRPAAAQWSVAPGSHRLHVEAPGFRSVDLPFDAKSDLSLSIPLPIAVAPALEQKLIAFANGAALSERERVQVWEIVFRVAGGDAIFVATRTAGGLHGRLFYRGVSSRTSATVSSTNEGEESLAEWAAATLVSMRSAHSTAVSTAKRFERGDTLKVRGGFGFSSRAWHLDGSDGGRFTADFSGVGPWAMTSVSRHGIVADATASLAEYGLRRETVTLGRGGNTEDRRCRRH